MALTITPDDLQKYMGVTVDTDRATELIAAAMELCAAYVSPVPDGAKYLVEEIAARAIRSPGGPSQEAIGPFSASYGSLAGVYITRAERNRLRRLAGRVAAFSVDPTPDTAMQDLPPWSRNGWTSDQYRDDFRGVSQRNGADPGRF